MTKWSWMPLAAFAVSVAACSPDAPREAAAEVPGLVSISVVDSILPIEEELRRFRATLGPELEGLSGGAPSRDDLVARFMTALASADTAAFADMLLTVDEFGWLYYPTTRFTKPPYELPPGLVWFQIQNGTGQGLERLLERLGGRPVETLGYACRVTPTVEGENRVWEECVVRFHEPGGDPREMAMFGGILERAGVFKFVTYGNGF